MPKQHWTGRRLFHQQIGLKFEKEASKGLHLEHNIIWCWNLDISEISEIAGNFRSVVLEKDGEYQLDRLREQWGRIA